MSEQPAKQYTAPLEWTIPPDLKSRPATNLTVQVSEHELTLSFFEAIPPILVGTDEEIKAKVSEIKSIQAVCVARIVISSSRYPEIVQVLQDNLRKYTEAFKSKQE